MSHAVRDSLFCFQLSGDNDDEPTKVDKAWIVDQLNQSPNAESNMQCHSDLA